MCVCRAGGQMGGPGGRRGGIHLADAGGVPGVAPQVVLRVAGVLHRQQLRPLVLQQPPGPLVEEAAPAPAPPPPAFRRRPAKTDTCGARLAA